MMRFWPGRVVFYKESCNAFFLATYKGIFVVLEGHLAEAHFGSYPGGKEDMKKSIRSGEIYYRGQNLHFGHQIR